MKLDHRISKDRAIPEFQKIQIYFNSLGIYRQNQRATAAAPFLPGGKICRLPGCKWARV